MEKYKIYQKRSNAVEKAEEWLSNANKKDSQCGNPYKLIKPNDILAFQYCGQTYAGANNYHDIPDSLAKALTSVIYRNFSSLIYQAMDELKEEERKALISCQDEIREIQKAIDLAKSQ